MSMHHSPRHPPRRRRPSLLSGGTPFVLFIIVMVVVVASGIGYLSSRDTRTCTVESKERTTHVQDGNSTQQKLVYTSNCGVLTVDDFLLTLDFNSADTYSKLQEGKTYRMETIGWRNGLFSWFPNVLSASEVRG